MNNWQVALTVAGLLAIYVIVRARVQAAVSAWFAVMSLTVWDAQRYGAVAVGWCVLAALKALDEVES